MPLLTEDIEAVKNALIELNCCSSCILKYLGYRCFEDGSDIFLNPENHSIFKNNDGLNTDEESARKKIKSNPCRACLGILNNETMEKCFETLPTGFEEYKMQDFMTYLTFPMSVYIREHSMFIYLKETFPVIYQDVQASRLENTKTIFKKASCDILGKKMNKAFSKSANFQINVNIQYEDENKEIENIKKLDTKKITRNTVTDVLAKCTDEAFKKHFPVPPNIQDKCISATITYSSSLLFLGGRYLKFSREMGQTPFIVNNKLITETSVQDIVFESICEVLGCEQQNLKICASGREDADTRMLGGGRPFYIQIEHPKFEKISYEQCRAIEASVLKSNAVVILKLQTVSQMEAKKIKLGEEKKKKHYRALCKTVAPTMDPVLNIISMCIAPLKINQTTPIRVLHRRSQMIRERYIYELKASKVEGREDLFYLDLVTQAGTYIKEFVNGDFNRTIPNISQLIGYPADVVALDVTDVDLEWP